MFRACCFIFSPDVVISWSLVNESDGWSYTSISKSSITSSQLTYVSEALFERRLGYAALLCVRVLYVFDFVSCVVGVCGGKEPRKSFCYWLSLDNERDGNKLRR